MDAVPGLSKNIKEANMDKLELYWSEIPMGKENAISYDKLCTAWGISQRAVRSILHKLSIYDNGDDTVLIRSSKDGGGFYRSSDPAEIAAYRAECLRRGQNTFAPLKKTRQRCPWIDKPIPGYELTSLRGKIKRVQARLAELDKLEAARVAPIDSTKHDGGEIVKNAELNRLQIVFDEIPGEETRAELKRNGFRWSPSNQAWQRQLTPNAEAAARRIFCID